MQAFFNIVFPIAIIGCLLLIYQLMSVVRILTHRLQNLERHVYGPNYDRYKADQ